MKLVQPLVKQGDIYWVDILLENNKIKTKPVLFISNSAFNNTSNTPIGFILTRSENKINNIYHYKLLMNDNKYSGVNISQIYTINKNQIKNYLQSVDMKNINNIIKKFNDIIIKGY